MTNGKGIDFAPGLGEAIPIEHASAPVAFTASQNPPAAKSMRHIPSLDGIRGLSFLLVFVAHAGLDNYVPGGFGVTIFFFLSGFLITSLLRTEFEKHAAVSLRHFWLRRILRILPPFYLVLAAAVLLQPFWYPDHPLSARAVLAEAFAIHELLDHPARL